MTTLLTINGATRRFGGLTAVDSVSTTVAKGELVGVIGPNGAGKTTLFNLISGFTPLSAGEVHFKGRRIDGQKPFRIARLGIGRTFQNLRIFPNMSVFDNVSVGAAGMLGVNAAGAVFGGKARSEAISRRAWAALEQVGLQSLAGELAMEPELIILDEPAAGLNDTETRELAAFIKRLHGEGMTVLLVEHDMGLVMGICERVVVLATGRKIADAAPEVVRKDPAVLEAYLGVEE